MSDLAASLLERRQEVKSNVQAVLATMADHHARGVPISNELAAAIPIIAATLMKSTNERMKGIGAKLVLESLKHNLNIYDYANSVDPNTGKVVSERVDVTIAASIRDNPDIRSAAVDFAMRLLPNGNPD